jgi:type II secretory pathway component PulF
MQADGLQGQPAFDWSGRDAQGRLHRGRSCAGGQNQLRALLRRRGLTAVDVHRARSQRIAKPSSDELVRFLVNWPRSCEPGCLCWNPCR